MRIVAVTGATGFVGSHLCSFLNGSGWAVRGSTRRPMEGARVNAGVEYRAVGDIGGDTDWRGFLAGVDSVVHLASIVHRPSGVSDAEYQHVNAAGSEALARQAAQAGVKRFVFVSSIKVNGEATPDTPFSPASEPAPADAYARSKLDAEVRLKRVCDRTGMHLAIVRPPLVYGPGVGANFRRLMRWVERGVPLPFGRIDNRRSLVSVWNLCDLLGAMLTASYPAAGVWMVSDGEDLSTPDLVTRIGRSMRRPARLLNVSPSALFAIGRLLRREGEVNRLCGSLTVDISATCRELHWSPATTVDTGLLRTVESYLADSKPRGLPPA